MNETNGAGVKTLSVKLCNNVFRSINSISRNRVADICHMYSYLMSASGFKFALNMSETGITFYNGIMSLGGSSAFYNSHFLSVFGASSDGSINVAFVIHIYSVNNGLINSVKAVFLDLFSKMNVSKIVLGNKKKSAGVFIDPVYNSGTKNAVYSGKTIFAMPQKRINKGTVVVARSRMNYHSFWFINNKKVVIFIIDIERNVFRFNVKRNRIRNEHGDIFPFFEYTAFGNNFSVDFDVSCGN